MPNIKILNCLEIKNETDTKADLYFYGDIVSDWWGAWQNEDQYPNAVKEFLDGQQGKDLNVYINSGGGSVLRVSQFIICFNVTQQKTMFKSSLTGWRGLLRR